MASTQADVRIRDLQRRAAELVASTSVLAAGARDGLADHDTAVSIGRTLGIAECIDRLASLLGNGGIPVSLLGLIERESETLIERGRP